jgi:hypothetical protein
VNVPPDDMAQYTGAVGAAMLAQQRWHKLQVGEHVIDDHEPKEMLVG